MTLSIPKTSGTDLPLPVQIGQRLFIVGANGSGKSALIQYLVTSYPEEKFIRISAHRQSWFRSGTIDLTPETRRQFAQNDSNLEKQPASRWMEYNSDTKLSATLFDLVSKGNERARAITKDVDAKDTKSAIDKSCEILSPIEEINNLLAHGKLLVTIENSGGEQLLAQHKNASEKYDISQMSDGERNAVIIAANVVTAEPGTTMLIDEPERHLHRSIIMPFLSALFNLRKDCAFIISTHEVSLPSSDPEASTLVVRSCQWQDEKPISWDAEIIEANIDLPEDLRQAILGSRKKILFVEGTSNSLDLKLYDVLFPDVSIIPVGSCVDVEKMVKGLRCSLGMHHTEAFGLIDRDHLGERKVTELSENNIFSLTVYSVESLYYCPESIMAVAKRQSESLRKNPNELYQSSIDKAFKVIKQDDLIKRMAAQRSERKIHNKILSKIPDWKDIQKSHPQKIQISSDSGYESEIESFQNFVDNEDWCGLIADYPLHKSGCYSQISKDLGLTGTEAYQQTLLYLISKDKDLSDKIKEYLGGISKAIESPENPQLEHPVPGKLREGAVRNE